MAEELRCSECGRPFTDEPCGLVHAIARVEIALLRDFADALMRSLAGGVRRG